MLWSNLMAFDGHLPKRNKHCAEMPVKHLPVLRLGLSGDGERALLDEHKPCTAQGELPGARSSSACSVCSWRGAWGACTSSPQRQLVNSHGQRAEPGLQRPTPKSRGQRAQRSVTRGAVTGGSWRPGYPSAQPGQREAAGTRGSGLGTVHGAPPGAALGHPPAVAAAPRSATGPGAGPGRRHR